MIPTTLVIRILWPNLFVAFRFGFPSSDRYDVSWLVDVPAAITAEAGLIKCCLLDYRTISCSWQLVALRRPVHAWPLCLLSAETPATFVMRKLLQLLRRHQCNLWRGILPWESNRRHLDFLNFPPWQLSPQSMHHFEGLKLSKPLRKQSFKFKCIDETSEVKFHQNFMRMDIMSPNGRKKVFYWFQAKLWAMRTLLKAEKKMSIRWVIVWMGVGCSQSFSISYLTVKLARLNGGGGV